MKNKPDVKLGTRQLKDIDYQAMSFEDIDDVQAQQILQIIEAWRNASLAPWEAWGQLHQAVNLSGGYSAQISETIGLSPDLETPDKETLDEKYKEYLEAHYRDMFRADLIDGTNQDQITSALNIVEQQLIEAELDSWDAAIALAEILTAQLPDQDEGFRHYSRQEEAVIDFKNDVKREKRHWLDRDARHNFDIMEMMKPDKESDIRKEALSALEAYKESSKSDHVFFLKGMLGYDINRDLSEYTDLYSGGDDKIWGEWGADGPLCNELYIAPSGSGLIKIDIHNGGVDSYYGLKSARVTTYTISFKPKNADCLEQLSSSIEVALSALKTVPRMHHSLIPGHGGELGNDYERPQPYVREKDGKLMILDKLDLDDLWTLYYMIEPLLEPNTQIASAMNMARYSEERGAPLDPDALYLENETLNASAESHVIQNNEHALAQSLKDAFEDVALKRISQQQFVSRLAVIADHTLQGTMHDPKKQLATYTKLIEHEKSHTPEDNQSELTTYEQAMHQRVCDLVRVLTGNFDEDAALDLALFQTINYYRPILMEQNKQQKIAGAEDDALRIHEKNQQARNRAGGDILKNIQKDLMIENDSYNVKNLSDAFDKLRGHKRRELRTFEGESGHEYDQYIGEAALVEDKENQLVIRDSDVETCLDEIHYIGHISPEWDHESEGQPVYYRSKTKGSIYPRKELPTKLKPFSPDQDMRRGFNAIEFKPL
jgi:hypothetical protein